MEQKHLKQAAASSLVLMCVVVLISVFYDHYNYSPNYVMAMSDDAEKDNASSFDMQNKDEPDRGEALDAKAVTDIRKNLGERYLIIPKADTSVNHVMLTENYMGRSITLNLTNTDRTTWDIVDVIRCNAGTVFQGEPLGAATGSEYPEPESLGASDPLLDYEVYADTENGVYIEIVLDSLYIPFFYEDKEQFYIDLKKPKEVYDKVLVIDAGHGGKHPGTLSAGKEYMEKDFNLEIVKQLKKRLDQENIKVYYTRLEDETVYLNPRVNLANDAGADFLISIHNNANDNTGANGTEVLYNEKEEAGKGVGSKQLALICLEEITRAIGSKSRGLRKGSEMYIIGHSQVPTALIEVEFLSNTAGLNFLSQEENLALTAEGIYNAIMKAYEQRDSTPVIPE